MPAHLPYDDLRLYLSILAFLGDVLQNRQNGHVRSSVNSTLQRIEFLYWANRPARGTDDGSYSSC
jgi:hypothetical protein